MIAWRGNTTAQGDTSFVVHGVSGNCRCCHSPGFATQSLEPESDEEAKARLRQEHRTKCQQAFRDPPRRQGRGSAPPRKWGRERRAPTGSGRGRRRGR